MNEKNMTEWKNAAEAALDEILTNYVAPNCEHITHEEWSDMENAAINIMDELIMHLSKL